MSNDEFIKQYKKKKKVEKQESKTPVGRRVGINVTNIEKAAPKGVDESKYKRCKRKVKRKNPEVNEYAVCAASLKKAEEFVKEYKLSKSGKKGMKWQRHIARANDLREKANSHHNHAEKLRDSGNIDEAKAKRKMAYELEDQAKIHDQKAIEARKLKKSSNSQYDFKNTTTRVDVASHKTAEETGPRELIQYLTSAIEADLERVILAKGILTVYRKDHGLYSGFFSDQTGQVVEQFENMTIPMIAKNLQVKDLYTPVIVSEDQAIIDPESTVSGVGYVRIKYGDFELEIKKSIQEFVSGYSSKNNIEKFIKAWRRNSKNAKIYKSNIDAAKALIKDWRQHGEEFSQIVDAIKRLNNE